MFFKKNSIGFEEFMKNYPNNKKKIIIVILKLFISEYSIKGDNIFVKLDRNYIRINNSDTPGKNGFTLDFWNAYFFGDNVRTCFLNEIKKSKYEGNLIGALNSFKSKYIVSGKDLKKKKFYKLYFTKKPLEVTLSSELNRSWIDYDKQLKKATNIRNIIFDSNQNTIIWGMTPQQKDQMVKSKQARKRYGNSLLTIKTLSNEKYVLFENEIIGKRFKVVGKKDLDNKCEKINLTNTSH